MAQTQSVDPKAYYGYLFAADKKPTKVLDALLRGIGTYIVDNIGNTDEKCLTPAKLATFYKAVGGNYDSLFVDVPPPSISWIYASIGCQHTLQPTNDDFQPPSIPALTIKGFVRWQSIEILLGPEEHVPFIQTAIQTFGIKHPDTGEPFPTDLPKEAFPLKPDAEIERWHNSCAEKLKLEARGDDVASRPELPPRPKVQAGFKHVPPRRPAHSHSPGRSPRSRPEMQEFFEPPTRPPIQFQHVSSQHVATHRPQRPPLSHSPSHRAQQFLAPEADRMPRPRRRSNPENMSYSPGVSPGRRASELYPPIPPPTHTRRHSHPRPPRAPSVSTASDSSGSDDESRGARLPRRSLHREPSPRAQQSPDVEPPPGIRHNIPPTAPVPPSPIPVQPIPRRVPRRAEHSSSSDERRKSWASNVPMDNTGKLSPQFLQGVKNIKLPRRRIPRPETRDSSRGANNVRWKELNEVREFERRNSVISVEESEPEVIPSRRDSREEGMSSSERERNRGSRYTDRDRDRELDTDRDVPLRPKMRPEMRRSSSHDTPRTEKERERERARDRDGRRRRIGRDRERERDRSPVRGVDGRRYPPTDAYR